MRCLFFILAVAPQMYAWDAEFLAGQGLAKRAFGNLQTFTGSLGGVAPPITDSDNAQRPFRVAGSTFTDFASAGSRSCNIQHNNCANAANARSFPGLTSVEQCDQQRTQCEASQASTTATAFQFFTSQDANFDYICD